jgi:hypothetical protein
MVVVLGSAWRLGIVFGFVARHRIMKSESLLGRRLALWGIVTGFVALMTTAGAITILVSHDSGSEAPPGTDVAVSGSPKAGVELAEQELVPPSDLPVNWTPGGGPQTQFTHDTFFGSDNVHPHMVTPLARCLGVDPAKIDLHPAEAADQMYGPLTGVAFNNTVDVYPMKDALIDITAATSPRVDECLLQLVVLPGLPGMKQAIGRGRTFSPPTVTQRRIVVAGEHDVDIETAYPWAIGSTHGSVDFDSIIVQRGRSESNIAIEGDGLHAPPLALVDRMVVATAQHMGPS